MSTKLVYFEDLKPTSPAASGVKIRHLNYILNFLQKNPNQETLNQINFFDSYFYTNNNEQIAGNLLFSFTMLHVKENKKSLGLFVDIETDEEDIDEEDFEDIVDISVENSPKLFYSFVRGCDLEYCRPLLNSLPILPKELNASLKQHQLLDFLRDIILSKIWLDSAAFKQEYRLAVLYIVFLYLSKHIDLTFYETYSSFLNWLKIQNLEWCVSDNLQHSLQSKELYSEFISYSMSLSEHITKAFIGGNVVPYKTAPSDTLFYFFEDRQDVRYEEDEDEDDFSSEFTSKSAALSDEAECQNESSPSDDSKPQTAKVDGYALVADGIKDSEISESHKKLIDKDERYEERKKEVLKLEEIIAEELIDSPIMSINQAWALIQDKWNFFLNTFSSLHFSMTNFVKTSILKKLKLLKKEIFRTWNNIKTGNGQRVFINVIAYNTFITEFLLHEAKYIQSSTRERFEESVYYELPKTKAKYLKELNLFDDKYDLQLISKIENEELKTNVSNILDKIYAGLWGFIDAKLKDDIHLINYFESVDKDIEVPSSQLVDSVVRVCLLNLIKLSKDVTLSDMKYVLDNLLDPAIKSTEFESFDINGYKNEIIKEVSISFRRRINPSTLLNLKNI